MNRPPVLVRALWAVLLALLPAAGFAQEVPPPPGLDERIDAAIRPVADLMQRIIFFKVPVGAESAPFVIFWLGGSAILLTLFFRFINLSGFRVALRTIRLRYSKPTDPGEITHFQALSAALSGTVGLGNIAGVAIGISVGGPGAAFWLFLTGFFGMTTKFCECTLGVRYREIDRHGKVYGGSFYTLRKGLAEIGLARFGRIMAVIFAICCVGGAFGGGNMFQVNQAFTQFKVITADANGVTWWADKGWLFGLFVAILTGLTIIGGIKSIARVTDKLTPFMCILYVASALYIVFLNFSRIPGAIGLILTEAFTWKAGGGGMLGALIWGVRRAAFSNEAGFGSAPTAHSAVRTRYPASEGYVALLEPFVDTVIVCSMTSLVIILTGQYHSLSADASTSQAIGVTSAAFATGGKIFPYLLFLSVLCFALSTLISWSYYGEMAWAYLFGRSRRVELVYKSIFCAFIVIGAASSLNAVVDFSDSMLFAMCFPNLIGLYLLLPKIREEIVRFREFRAEVDREEVP